MKEIKFNDLVSYSDLPNTIQSSQDKKLKTKEEVMREFNKEKWGSILENLLGNQNKKLEDIDMVMENFNKDKIFFYKKKFFLGTGKEVFDLHLDLYKNFLKDHLEDVSCLVELGAGYGSKILNLSQHNEFKHLPLYASEYTSNGCESIKILAERMQKKIKVGLCDFKELTIDDIGIPKGGLVFTSYAAHYAPLLSDQFTKFINQLEPKLVVHFEPIYEYHLDDDYGLMCKKYIEMNDYNLNMGSVLDRSRQLNKINITVCKNILGGNPFLPLSVVKWSSAELKSTKSNK